MSEADTIDNELIDRLAANTEKALQGILQGMDIANYEISDQKVAELAECLFKDLKRLQIHQSNAIADTKFAAYWSFWIRKLKPVRVAWGDATKANELTDINERAALELAIAVLKKSGKNAECTVRRGCKHSCDGAECIDRYTAEFFSANDAMYSEYIVYSMGKRTFGPHHMCAILDSILFAACDNPAGMTIGRRS